MTRDGYPNHCLHPFVVTNVATYVSRVIFTANVIAHALWTNFRGRFCLLLRLRWRSFLRRLGLFLWAILARTVPSLCRLFRFGSIITHDEMKQWLAQLFIGKNNWVIPISNQFDMSIDNSPQRSTHANVGTNPCGEKEEFVVEKVPSRRPWKRHIVDTEGLNCRCKPAKIPMMKIIVNIIGRIALI